MGSQNHPEITKNLNCQKTESTIVLAMLQSTGKSQVVSSHRRRTDNASEEVFGPRLRRGLDHAPASFRFAALARSSGEDGKKKDAQKEPNDLQELCPFSANVTLKKRKSGAKNDPKS